MEVTITREAFNLVENDEGEPILQDETILIQRIQDGECFFAPLTDAIKNIFNIKTTGGTSNNSSTRPLSKPSQVETSKYWNKNAVLALIQCYKKFEQEFMSSTTRNDQIWSKVAEQLQARSFMYTPSQCRDKWKYLKLRYTKKKDNMRRETGTEQFKFDYFEEMDLILGDKPNITPVSVASSSRSNNTIPMNIKTVTGAEFEETDEEIMGLEPKKKRRRRCAPQNNENLLANFKMHREQREAARQRRHEELLAVRKAAIDSYNEKMDALLKKL